MKIGFPVRCYSLVGRSLLVPAFVFGTALIGVKPGAAVAQQVMSFSSIGDGPGGGGFKPPVTTRDLERYSAVLGLNDEQKASAKAMIESVVSEFNGVAKEAREKMAEVEAEFQETRDPSVFRDKMPGAMRKLREKRGELEKTFLEDLRLILTAEQEANWGRFERLRRRESNQGGGVMGLAGESVDLVKVGETVGVIDGPTYGKAIEPVRALFEQYENELDKALQEKSRVMAENPVRAGGGERMDPEAIQKAVAAVREKSVALRDINQKYARQIGSELGEPLADKWNAEVKKTTFPQVYREAYASRALKSALEMGDLSSEQRSTLQGVGEQLERELAGANDALAKAIAEADESGDRGGMVGGGGGPTMIRFGAEPESVKAARAAKREVENRAMEKVNGTLTEGQRSKLPKRGNRRAGPSEMPEDGEVHMEFIMESSEAN